LAAPDGSSDVGEAIAGRLVNKLRVKGWRAARDAKVARGFARRQGDGDIGARLKIGVGAGVKAAQIRDAVKQAIRWVNRFGKGGVTARRQALDAVAAIALRERRCDGIAVAIGHHDVGAKKWRAALIAHKAVQRCAGIQITVGRVNHRSADFVIRRERAIAQGTVAGAREHRRRAEG
jgi:hypothetical protein